MSDESKFRPCIVRTNVHTIVRNEGSTTFEWHSAKAKRNRLKHGVRFTDATEAFFDDNALTLEDPDSPDERRYVLTGLGGLGTILTLVFTYRGLSIRLISARQASRREERAYWGDDSLETRSRRKS